MIRRIALSVVAAVLTVVATALPAHADDEIGVSSDGTTWAPELAAPLFPVGFTWVPGDVEERSFLVRNEGPSASEVNVEVVASDPQGLLSPVAVALEARVGAGKWVAVADGVERLVTTLEIPPGARTTVTVRGSFVPEATDHMDEVAPFSIRVTMAGAGDVGGVSVGDGAGDGVLPDTGSPFGVALIWLAAGLIGTGLAVAGSGRGRREVRHG